jgi:hypothetical protein
LALPAVPMMLFVNVPLNVLLKGAFPLWKLLIATAREPWKLLLLTVQANVVAIGSVEQSTPALLFVKVQPETLTVWLVP